MLSKKYILFLALSGLIFSCQKETIRPNNSNSSFSKDANDSPAWRSSVSSGNSENTGNSAQVINNNKTDIDVLRNSGDSDITDPNNDDDRNKKKKN